MKAFAQEYEGFTYEIEYGEIRITGCDTDVEGDIEIPNTIDDKPVTTIKAFALRDCTKITSISIPENCISVSGECFFHCSSLVSILVDPDNPEYCSDRGILYSKDKSTLVCAPNKSTGTSFIVPNGVSTLGGYAFYENSDLKSISLPNVATIKAYCFCGCEKLQTVFSGKSLSSIGFLAFEDCTSLESILVDSDNATYCSDNGILYDKEKTKLVLAPNKGAGTDFTVPKGVKTIGTNAFLSDSDLESITLTDVTVIENNAFSGCTSLKTVDLGKKLREVGSEAFGRCYSLEEIVFPRSLEIILHNPFWYDRNLKKIYFKGDCPKTDEIAYIDDGNGYIWGVFYTITGTAYYPEGNETWTEENRETLRGIGITWETWIPDPEDPEPDEPDEPDAPESSEGIEQYSYSFSNSSEAFGYPKDYTIPLSSYQLIYGNNVRAEDMYLRKTYVDIPNKIKRYWAGNCAGMSATCEMLADTTNGINPIHFNSSAKDPKDLKVKDTNTELEIDLTTFIEAMHVAQFTQIFKNDRSGTRVVTSDILAGKTNLNDFHDKIKAETDAGRPVLLAMMPGNGQGHAVLGYAVEDHDDVSEIMIYDNRHPLKEMPLTLTKDSKGNYTEWSFDMDVYGVWGTEQESSNISFVYYDTLMEIWKTRGNLAENNDTNMLTINSDDFSLYSSTGEELARVENGELVKTNNDIDLMERELSLRIDEEPDNVIVAPIAVYRVVNNDDSIEKLEVSAANEDLGASISTTADEVVVAVQDSINYNSVTVCADSEDTYSVSLKSTLNDDYNEIIAEGKGTEEEASISMIGGVLDVEDCALSSLVVDGEDQGPFTIKASAQAGGKIAPEGDSQILKGENQNYTITPNTGYVISDVLVDGKSVGAVAEYEFKNIDKDHTIEAKFKRTNLYGDTNGDNQVDAKDLTTLARHLAKIETITGSELLGNSDVNHDGKVTAEDLTKLARFIAKIISSLD